MIPEKFLILLIVLVTAIFFFWGRVRHDVVALGCLLVCVLTGLVGADDAFSGFGHPAVITVAAVLILSGGLQRSGVVDALARRALPSTGGLTIRVLALTGLAAIMSAFINNVGAMALLMPVAMNLARKFEKPPGQILMPLSFATILGGMTTLIGTPPNLIVSGFRADAGLESFGMFDFAPVGLAVAVSGVLLVALVGWRLVPARRPMDADTFETGRYFTEVRVTEDSKTAGVTVREADQKLAEADAQIIGMVRNQFRVFTPVQNRILQPGDILTIEADPESLSSALSLLDLELEQAEASQEPDDSEDTQGKADEDDASSKQEESGEAVIREMVSMPNSQLVGQSADDVLLRERYGLNLLAISRKGRQSIRRLRSTRFQAGDVLLLQGSTDSLSAFSSEFGSIPLAERSVNIPDTGKATMATVVMALAVVAASFGLVPAAIAFTVAVVVFVLMEIVPPAKLYDAIDWPVIVLLGALLPVAEALARTGAADMIAGALVSELAANSPIIAVALVLIVTMTLSDFMNNAATAAVMCPIAISVAAAYGASPDSFLMAVAIGASCAMLTPIGHQNNTLILGPGGFQFGDYWRLGLPLEILVVGISVPLLLIVWPL